MSHQRATRSGSSASRRPTTQARSRKEAGHFTLFRNLPKELRFRVYELAFPRRVLHFCQHELIVKPLGPPVIAQACREAWEFAKAQYRCLTYRAPKPPEHTFVDLPTTWRPPQQTWFNPRVDVLCIDSEYNDVVYHYDPRDVSDIVSKGGIAQIETYVSNANVQGLEEPSTYLKLVHSILPFAKIAEAVVV